MTDPELLKEVSDAFARADADGYQRGYAQATQDFFGQNAAFLFANIFADAMEAAGGRLAAHDPGFVTKLHQFAGVLRASVAPPTVDSTTPADGEPGVAHDAPVTAKFSMDMDPASISGTSFFVQAASGGAPLTATVTYDRPSRTATLVATNGFTTGVEYRATVEAARSAAGVGMPQAHSWTFTAGGAL